MPIAISESSNDHGIGYVFECRFNGQDLIEANSKLISMFHSSPEKMKGKRYFLIDQSSAESFDYSQEEFRTILDQDRELLAMAADGVMVAILAPSELHYGFARMWEIYTKEWGWDVMIFREREKAEKWLRDRIKEKYGIELKGTYKQ